MLGQVYKAHSNSYYVCCDGKIYKCGARGVLKIKSDGICVGDYVEFNNGVIDKVLSRKSKFIRPNVANVDVILAVVSPLPKPDFFILDKLFISAQKENTEFIIVVNKTDINEGFYKEIYDEYSVLGVEVIGVSAKNLEGVDLIKQRIKNKTAVLAGQSAVGKTSIVNAMFSLDLKTGDLSEKILRGKHTTTRSEIFEYEEYKIVDSPGFAVIEASVTLEELPSCYPEYLQVANECKFRGCNHVSEPECRVKELVDKGVFSKNRYERYLEIYDEISKRREIYAKN